MLADLPSVQLVFAGDGVDLTRLQSLVAERRLANVRFLGWVPAERMSKLYALTDVLLVTLRDAPVFQITIPHKVFAYMASAKPVLAAVEGDTASVVLGAEAGLQCSPNQPQAMANAIRQFHAMSAEQRRTMGENGRRAVVEQYGRQRLVGQVADMLRAAVDRRKRRL